MFFFFFFFKAEETRQVGLVSVGRKSGKEDRKNRRPGLFRKLSGKKSGGKYIMLVDATNYVEERFIEKSLRHFNDKSVIAVSGTLRSTKCNSTLSRWRARHLFKEQSIGSKKVRSHMLITYGTLFSRDALKTAGGFNPNLRYKEDEDVGNRL